MALRDVHYDGSSSSGSSDDEPRGEEDALLVHPRFARKGRQTTNGLSGCSDVAMRFSPGLFGAIAVIAAVAAAVTSWQALEWAPYEQRCDLTGCYDHIPGVLRRGKPPDEVAEGRHLAGPVAAVVSVAAVTIAALAAARTLL